MSQNESTKPEEKVESPSVAAADTAAEPPLSLEEEKHLANVVMLKRCLAELIGTAVLVFVGCGAAVGLSMGGLGEGTLAHVSLAVGTALAFGLVVTALSYALGEYSGCHVNPAVTFALYLNHKIGLRQMLCYWVAQLIGGLLGGALLLLFFGHGNGGVASTLASNTVNMGILSVSWGVVDSAAVAPAAYSAQGWPFLFLGLAAEILFTFAFVFTILCTGHKKENGPVSGIALGLSLTAIVLLGFNITGTGCNPARSIGTAVMCMANGEFEPIKEIWIFILGPMAGAALAVLAYRAIWHAHGASAPHHPHFNPFRKGGIRK